MKRADKKRIRKSIIIFAAVILFFALWTAWSEVPFTAHLSVDLQKADQGEVRIALLTDLHSCYYGKNQKNLLRRIEKENPDLIILGGDIFDDVLDDKNSKITVEALVAKYPCFYVTGNHEYWSEHVDETKQYLKGVGVSVLAGDCETIEISGLKLDVCGVDDPTRMLKADWENQVKEAFDKTEEDHIKILASHRPECVDVYEKYDFDLVLSGHAHSGQIRIPFLNKGLYSPNQGFMAEYVNGLYPLSNGCTLVVSRGLARESTPAPRFFNHPEVLILTVH